MTNFTPVESLIGGALIGAGAFLLLLLNGRILGVSGIVATALEKPSSSQFWRYAFIIGLILAPVVMPILGLTKEWQNPISFDGQFIIYLIGGLLVGLGTILGSGCTSGHGVCGIGRLSKRSIVATITFMAVAMLTLFTTKHFL